MADQRASTQLLAGQLLVRNVLWSILGLGLPLLVGLLVIPHLLRGLGLDRFGVLVLIWSVIGYFSLFDLGLGRALTKLVAERLVTEDAHSVQKVIWTGLMLMALLGLAGGMALGILTPLLVHKVLNIPDYLIDETEVAMILLAVSVPIVILTTGLRGVLEAYQRFGWSNSIRIVMGLLTFVGPLAVSYFSVSLVPIVIVLLLARVVVLMAHAVLCVRLFHSSRAIIAVDRASISALMLFGGWMTVTNLVGPLMVYWDRFLIGAVLSVAAVSYYATPYEVITKLWLIPAALAGVLFPAFAASFVLDQDRARHLFERGTKIVFVSMFPLILVVVTLAHPGLVLWLGADFASASTLVLQWLAVGVFLNSLAHVPYVLIQGAGRPDLTAKAHVVELIIYAPLLWYLLIKQDIVGAAVAWTFRAALDVAILFALASRLMPRTTMMTPRAVLGVVIALLCFLVGGTITGLQAGLWYLLLCTAIFLALAWHLILNAEERMFIYGYLKIGRVTY